MQVLLSIVIPVIKINDNLKKLIYSLNFSNKNIIEIVIVNQTGLKLISNFLNPGFEILEIFTEKVLSAPSARNYGANYANGKYLFFIDDDAWILNEKTSSLDDLIVLLFSNIDVVICQRGELKNEKYLSHWKPNCKNITFGNFSNFVIEWNVIIKKDLFFRLGSFPEIGTGVDNAAQSGEIFVLFANVLNNKSSIVILPIVKIVHPSLLLNNNNSNKLKGYIYGAGYAIGYSIKYFSFIWKSYWFFRLIFASIFDLLIRFKDINRVSIKINLIYIKWIGFFDGIIGKPKPKSYIIK